MSIANLQTATYLDLNVKSINLFVLKNSPSGYGSLQSFYNHDSQFSYNSSVNSNDTGPI